MDRFLIEKRVAELREKTYNEMLGALAASNRCHLTRPTGFGKSVLFRRYITEHPEEKILYVSDRKGAVAEMSKICDARTYMWQSRKVSLDEHLAYALTHDTIIFDESHLLGSHNGEKVVEAFKKSGKRLLAGSATPLRTDGINVSDVMFNGFEVSRYDIRDAINDGLMEAPLVVALLYLRLRIQRAYKLLADKRGGKYGVSQLTSLERAISERTKFESGIDKAVAAGGKGIWIVFHPSIMALEMVADDITSMFGKGAKEYRVSSSKQHIDASKFKAEHNGEFCVVHSVDMLNTGWHFDGISGVVLNRLVGSPVLMSQQVGRAMVLGGSRAVIVDAVGGFTAQRQSIPEIIGLNGKPIKSSKDKGDRQPPDIYRIDADPIELEWDKVLTAIETWAQNEHAMTPEEVVAIRRKYLATLKDCSRLSGLSEQEVDRLAKMEDAA